MVFSPRVGNSGEALSIIRAKERVQAALAETARRLELEAEAAKAAADALREEQAGGEAEAEPPALSHPAGAGVPEPAPTSPATTAGACEGSGPSRSHPRRKCAKAPVLAVSKRQYKKRASK
jgi:hypothetical protein